LKLAVGKFKEVELPFDKIPEAVATGKVDAGLIIHEAQITYDRNKFTCALDLGSWWSGNTGGLPVPLGINVASTRSMSKQQIMEFSKLFTESIAYGLRNIDEGINYAMKYGRGQGKEIMKRFVKMYVNDLTLDMGSSGRRAIEKMFAMAREKKIIEAGDFIVDVL
jgi:1,4-dihydroxy-6-naphthoate synthase